MMPISLVVITYNEAANIARCLDSVGLAAEKIVVDCGSDDDTRSIAAAHGARVVEQPWLGYGAQRNFGSGLASHDWILSLDADEALTPELALALEQGLPPLLASDAAAGVLFRTAWFMGRPMRWYRTMVRERKARIYHRQRARWSEARVHESLQYRGAEVVFRPAVPALPESHAGAPSAQVPALCGTQGAGLARTRTRQQAVRMAIRVHADLHQGLRAAPGGAGRLAWLGGGMDGGRLCALQAAALLRDEFL
jgi:hypothetical protein